MTEQLRQELEDRLDKAEQSGDQKLINEARRAIDHHTLECQAHTADRVKRIESDVIEIGRDVKTIRSSIEVIDKKCEEAKATAEGTKAEFETYKATAKGAATGVKGLWEVLKWIVAAGGGAALLKLLGGHPV